MNYNNVQQGQWCPICAENKRIKTRIKRYGVPYLMQNVDIALKSAKNCNNFYTLFHWETGEELICVGLYEKEVVQWLNDNKKPFKWQSVAFKLPNNTTYRPDLYLINENLWIEIKGYFRKDAKEKWEWFHKEYPNSKLWDKKKIKDLLTK